MHYKIRIDEVEVIPTQDNLTKKYPDTRTETIYEQLFPSLDVRDLVEYLNKSNTPR